MNGNIPEKLLYICRPLQTVNTTWMDSDKSINSLQVQPVYVSDLANKNTIKTGTEWAGKRVWIPDEKDSTGLIMKPGYSKEVTPELIEMDNAPIPEVRIVGYQTRMESFGVYKAVIFDKYYIDFPGDVMLDVILTSEIKNAIMKGPFIWARVKSDMKLVRVGSWLHSEMVKATQKDEMRPIKDLEIGGVYQSKSGEQAVFLGSYNNIVTYETTNEYTGGFYHSRDRKIKKTVYKSALVFRTLRGNELKNGKLDAEYPYLTIKKSHVYKEKIGQMVIPTDWWNIFASKVKSVISQYKKSDSYYYQNVAYYSPILHFLKDPVLNDLESYPGLIK